MGAQFLQAGSSPRVRGTDTSKDTHLTHIRFIPACAGNRRKLISAHDHAPVHPRVCGEQLAIVVLLVSGFGSSPRVRGTGCRFGCAIPASRFIPACAGNRHLKGYALDAHPVHPRVCGEQTQIDFGSRPRSGSSPRVRGTARDCRPASEWIRFIPACAGNRHTPCHVCELPAVHPRVCGEQKALAAEWGLENGSSPRVRGTDAVKAP